MAILKTNSNISMFDVFNNGLLVWHIDCLCKN
jgi:hypothetical protein